MSQPITQPPATPQVGRIALFYGVRAGLLLGIAQSVLIISRNHGDYSPYSSLIIPFTILLWALGLLLAGAIAAKQLGKTSIGTLAGLWAGIIGGVITAGTLLFEFFSAYIGAGYDLATIIGGLAGMMTGMLILVLLTMGAGSAMGALGGLIGQSFFTKAPTSFPQYQKHESPQQQKTE